jgi:hypothetical protein
MAEEMGISEQILLNFDSKDVQYAKATGSRSLRTPRLGA